MDNDAFSDASEHFQKILEIQVGLRQKFEVCCETKEYSFMTESVKIKLI